MQITVNGERRELPGPVSVTELLYELGLRPEHVAVEVNKDLVTRSKHSETVVGQGDVLEVVRLVGGGAGAATIANETLVIGTHRLRSRLLVGTGKYRSNDEH